jgi:cytochrome P450
MTQAFWRYLRPDPFQVGEGEVTVQTGNAKLPAYPFPFGPFGTSTLAYDDFRKSAPVTRIQVPSGLEVWLVTSYDDICFVHKDERFSRSEAVRVGATLAPNSGMELAEGVLQNLDGPRHTTLREIFAHHYDPAHVSRWTAVINSEAHSAIDAIKDKQIFDLRKEFFEPASRRAAERIFGLPLSTGPRVLELFFDPILVENLNQKLESILDGESIPRESYLGDLKARCEAGALSRGELIMNLIVFCTVTFEAVGGPFLGGIFALLRDRNQWNDCLQNRSILPNVVEEMLRCFPNGDGQFLRIAMEDVVLQNVKICKGDVVLAPAAAANADPAVFPDPRRFDIRRPNSKKNVAFAVGRHHCLGWAVSKTWMLTALTALLDRLPSLHLATKPEDVTYRHMPLISIMESLPVSC